MRRTTIRPDHDRPMTEEDRRLAAEAAAYAASDAAYAQYQEAEEDAPMGPPPDAQEALAALETGIVEDLVRLWRAQADVAQRVDLARDLWASGQPVARIAAAKLLIQARLRPDDGAWALILSWLPDLDDRALADQVGAAGARRVMADPGRLDVVADWILSPHPWTRRMALIVTLPLAKANHLSEDLRAARDRVLGWCAELAPDRDPQVQKAVAGWIRDLSKHDAGLARGWLAAHGAALKPALRKDAGRFV